ncbi:MAG: hypothetical protein ACTS7I_00880 [Candidatus Hodgkinia cicadicola]
MNDWRSWNIVSPAARQTEDVERKMLCDRFRLIRSTKLNVVKLIKNMKEGASSLLSFNFSEIVLVNSADKLFNFRLKEPKADFVWCPPMNVLR